jgi:RNA polymerase sigma factor (sigma-70 family)
MGADEMTNQDTIMSERRHLINLAYRLLGSLAEAEDVVQETYARWYTMSRQQQEAISSPAAWLTKVASRICLDLLGSARARRERYTGEWLPEPLPEPAEWPGRPPDTADPADRVTLDESVTMAFLVVLESMTPAERVALILHDVFGYSFAEVADITGRTPAACRQLASSARRRIRAAQSPPAPAARQASLIRDFKQAWEAGDIDALLGLLDPGATVIADGGGLVSAALHPIEGGEQVAHYLVDITGRAASLTILERTVNGQPGLVARQDGVTVTVFAFDVEGDLIKHIWAVRNPDKLRPWTPLAQRATKAGEMVGGRQAGRPRPYHQHPLTRRRRIDGHLPAAPERLVASEAHRRVHCPRQSSGPALCAGRGPEAVCVVLCCLAGIRISTPGVTRS